MKSRNWWFFLHLALPGSVILASLLWLAYQSFFSPSQAAEAATPEPARSEAAQESVQELSIEVEDPYVFASMTEMRLSTMFPEHPAASQARILALDMYAQAVAERPEDAPQAVVHIVGFIIRTRESPDADKALVFAAEKVLALFRFYPMHARIFRPALEELRVELEAQMRLRGFDPAKRYREEDLEWIDILGEFDPFPCTPLIEELVLMSELSVTLQRPDTARWAMHVKDARETPHDPCGEESVLEKAGGFLASQP